ncbi:MFS domain-containing protein [Durusdinium trenchii]|uniref:MFS domain-containing protein n=1 Tax=Durusdinium trenchii TaxID=1381693 RepID=A0ABP0M487_9DINO
MAAIEGKEGMYLAITMAPMYLAALPVGIISGWCLATFCPQNVPAEERRSQLMWLIIGVTGFISPVALWIFQKRLILPEDSTNEPEDDGEGEIRQTRRLRDSGDVGASPSPHSPQKAGQCSDAQEPVFVIGRPVEDGEL